MNTASLKRSLWITLVSEVFLSTGVGMAIYAQPFLFNASGLSDRVIGFLFAVNALTGGMTALVGGSAIDRIGTTRVFRAASLILPLGFLVMSSVHSTYLWGLSVCITGFGGSLLMCTENVVMKSLAQGVETANVLSKFASMYTFVMAGAALFAGYLCPRIGYGHTILLASLIGLVSPVMRLWVAVPSNRSDKLFRLPSRRIWRMSLYATVFALAVGLLNPFLTLILKERFGFVDATTSMFSSLNMFMMAFGAFLVNSLLRRFRRNNALLLSFTLAGTFTLALVFTQNGWLFIAAALLRSAAGAIPGSIVDAAFLGMVMETEYAQMFGVRVFGSNLGNAVGSYVGGTLLTRHLMPELLVLSAAAILVSYFTVVAILRRSIDPFQESNVEELAT